MIKHWESTLNQPPNCPRNGVHLCLKAFSSTSFVELNNPQ